MAEAFLVLLAGGILLAAAVSNPREVTLPWLRLAGILALALAALAVFFFLRRQDEDPSQLFWRVRAGQLAALMFCILAQLAFVQVAWRRTQRIFAGAGYAIAVLAGTALIHHLMVQRGSAVNFPPKLLSMALQAVACAGASAMVGLVLMDMLLGHAYLTASRMTVAPFRRLNLALAVVLALRAVSAIGLVLALQLWRPVEMLWQLHGLLIGTRYFVGLLIPAIFIYMAHDCIRRRATQSATGILYVCGVLVFIGEICGLFVMQETGLPF